MALTTCNWINNSSCSISFVKGCLGFMKSWSSGYKSRLSCRWMGVQIPEQEAKCLVIYIYIYACERVCHFNFTSKVYICLILSYYQFSWRAITIHQFSKLGVIQNLPISTHIHSPLTSLSLIWADITFVIYQHNVISISLHCHLITFAK